MLMVAVGDPTLTTTDSRTPYASYPFSCRAAARRQLQWLVDYTACGDREAAEQAALDLCAIYAELTLGAPPPRP